MASVEAATRAIGGAEVVEDVVVDAEEAADEEAVEGTTIDQHRERDRGPPAKRLKKRIRSESR